jgi:hypothetical protein
MVVFGQPTTSAEYIQAACQMTCDQAKPGLVVVVLNPGNPRDRARFERFTELHNSFYRAREYTGVTPFSARVLDRNLAAAAVVMARHGHRPMTPPGGADAIVTERANLGFVAESLGKRAETHVQADPDDLSALRRAVESKTGSLLQAWEAVSNNQHAAALRMKYYEEEGNESEFLLRNNLSDELNAMPLSNWKARFSTGWSMRDAEPAVNLAVQGPGELNLDEDSG